MPPAYEILLLNTAIPQIQAAQSGDTYVVPRDIAFSAALTLSAGTANGVPYLNGSKAVTTGSALTFDGTNIALGTVGAKVNFATTGSATQNYVGVASDGYSLEVKTQRGALQPITYKQDYSVGHVWELTGSEAARLTSDGLEIKQSQLIGYSSYASIGTNGLAVAGNVGIGTSSPGQKLEVAGKVLLNTNAPQLILNRTGTTYQSDIKFQTAGTNNWSIGQALGAVGSNLEFYDYAAGATRMQLDSSGNLGLGVTPSAWGAMQALQIGGGGAFAGDTGGGYRARVLANAYFTGSGYKYINTAPALLYTLDGNTGGYQWNIAASGTAGNAISFTQAMTLDASGNLGVGTTNPSSFDSVADNLVVGTTSGNNGITIAAGTTGAGTINFADGTTGGAQYAGYIDYQHNGDFMRFGTNGGTERARITSGGNFLVGTDNSSESVGPGLKLINSAVSPAYLCVMDTATAGNSGFIIYNVNATNNGYRAYLQSNGGLANYQANDVNLSDERLKTDVTPVASYWDKIKSLEIVSFKYKDQSDSIPNIGVIAQQVESVAPEFVSNDGFGEAPEGEAPYKTIYTTDMYHAAIKALQEAMSRIETLEAKIAALEQGA